MHESSGSGRPRARAGEFLCYHSPEKMGYPASEVRSLEILTNKRVSSDVVGARVWLVTGEGRPRTYYLRGWFRIDTIESGDDEGYRLRIAGREGRRLHPMPVLNEEPWFARLRRSQGSFAFGFQAIGDASLVRALEGVARSVPRRTGGGVP